MRVCLAALMLQQAAMCMAQVDRFQRVGLTAVGSGGVPEIVHKEQQASVRAPIEVSAASLGPAKVRDIFVSLSNRLFVANGVVFLAARPEANENGLSLCEDGGPFLAAKITHRRFFVSQVVDKTTVLIEDSSAAVRVPSTASIVDGQRMTEWLSRGDQALEYVSVIGAPRKVPLLMIAEVAPASFEQFTAALAAGSRFLCLRQAPSTCPGCEGRKFIAAKNRSAQIVCPTCAGRGTVPIALLHSLGK